MNRSTFFKALLALPFMPGVLAKVKPTTAYVAELSYFDPSAGAMRHFSGLCGARADAGYDGWVTCIRPLGHEGEHSTHSDVNGQRWSPTVWSRDVRAGAPVGILRPWRG